MKLVYLEYTFLFDPSETWPRLSQFETELAKFLATKGLIAEPVRDILGKNPIVLQKPVLSGKKIIQIYKSDKFAVPTQQTQPLQGRPLGTKGMFDKQRQHNISPRERDFRQGKVLTRKGYLKKENG